MNFVNRPLILTFLVVFTTSVSHTGVSANVLLMSDTFDRVVGNPILAQNGGESDWGMNDNNLGGTHVQTYRVTPTDLVGEDQQYVQGSTGRLRHGTSLIDLDLTTLAPLGYRLEFDFKRGLNNSTAFIIGRDSTEGGLVMSLNDTDTDFGVKVRPFDGGNDLEFYEHGALVASVDGFWLNAQEADAWHHAIIAVTSNGYTPGGAALVNVYINGTPVYGGSFNWDAALPITAGAASLMTGGTKGTVGFASSGDDAEYDSVELTAGLHGDLDGDGFIGISDLNMILSCWNLKVSSDPSDPHRFADVSGDNFVGIDDLNAVLSNWNAGGPPSTSVPEPGSLTFLGVVVAAICLRRSVAHTNKRLSV